MVPGLCAEGMRKCLIDAETEAQKPSVPMPLPLNHLQCSSLSPTLATPSPDARVSLLQKQNKDEEAINEIMEDLDTNQDKQLSFEEFIMLVARLTVASHEEMHKTAPPGKGHRHGPGFDKGGAGPCPGQGGPGHSHGGHGHSHGGHGHGHSH